MHTKFMTATSGLIDTEVDINMNIEDIARALSRTFRCRGQSDDYFSVSDHSLFVYELIKNSQPNNYCLQLSALLHDIEEALIGDIPTGVKTMLDSGTDHRLKHIFEAIRREMALNLKIKNELNHVLYFSDREIKIADDYSFVVEVLAMTDCVYKQEMLEFMRTDHTLNYYLSDTVHSYGRFIEQVNTIMWSYRTKDFIETMELSKFLFIKTFYNLVDKIKSGDEKHV